MATTGLREITFGLPTTAHEETLDTMAFEEGMPPLVTTACDVAMVELSTTVDEWVVWAGGGSPQGDLIDAILSRRTTSQTNPVPWPSVLAMGRGSRASCERNEKDGWPGFSGSGLMRMTGG